MPFNNNEFPILASNSWKRCTYVVSHISIHKERSFPANVLYTVAGVARPASIIFLWNLLLAKLFLLSILHVDDLVFMFNSVFRTLILRSFIFITKRKKNEEGMDTQKFAKLKFFHLISLRLPRQMENSDSERDDWVCGT